MKLKIYLAILTFSVMAFAGNVNQRQRINRIAHHPKKTVAKKQPVFYKELKSKKEVQEIDSKNGKHIIEYYTQWCGACNDLKPVFDETAKEYIGRANFYTVNLDDDKEIAKEKKIEAVPTIAFVKDGKEVLRERGSMSKKELENSVERFVNGQLK